MLPDPATMTLAREAPIEVVILTGFLGSGKTSLLRRALSRPGLADTAVVINEFGTVPLDHVLVEHGDDLTTVVGGACLCCAAPGRMAMLLTDLLRRHYACLVPPFARVVIETSGLADPLPLIEAFAADPLRLSRLRLARVVTAVDADRPAFATDKVAANQLAAADLVVLTKTDLVTADAQSALRASIRARSHAPIVDGWSDAATRLFAGPSARRDEPRPSLGTDDHARRFVDLSAVLPGPLPTARLLDWMETFVGALGSAAPRLKGLVRLAEGGAVEINAAGPRLHPWRAVDLGPGREGRIVTIVERHASRSAQDRLDALAGLAA